MTVGYTQHRFFIVHSPERASVEQAHTAALDVFGEHHLLVGPILASVVNTECGFIVFTSGSKAGWGADDEHVARLDALVDRLAAFDHPPRWVRINSGDDDDDFNASRGPVR